MVTVVRKMDTAAGVQILDEVVSILHRSNTLGKGMNLTSLLPAMAKIAVIYFAFCLDVA